jgi:hypothetical protein
MQFALKRQLTVSLQNQPGRLAEVSELIAKNGFNIEALCVIDNNEQSVVRLLVDEPARCKEALIDAGFSVVDAEVLALPVADRRGKLAEMTRALATSHINIDYAYASVDHDDEAKRSLIILKVSNTRLAEQVLHAVGGAS